MGHAGSTFRSMLGPTGWLVPLWALVLALRFDRRAVRPRQPVVTRRLLGAGALSLAVLLAPSTTPSVAAVMAAVGGGLLLAGQPWRRLCSAIRSGVRLLAVTVVPLGRVLRVAARAVGTTAVLFAHGLGATARILIDPFVLPPIVVSDTPPESHRRPLPLPRGRLPMPERGRIRQVHPSRAAHPDGPYPHRQGKPTGGA